MRLNIYNSLLLSSFIHSLFAAVFFIVLPKLDDRVHAQVDISFLFSEVEKKIQNRASIKKILSKSETYMSQKDTKVYENYSSPFNPLLQGEETMGSVEPEPSGYLSTIESLSSHKSDAVIQTNEGYLPVVSNVSKYIGNDSGYVRSTANKESALDSQSHISVKASNPSVSTGADIDKSTIIRAFTDRIESLKHYPYIARRKGIEGTVIVLVHLDRTGELKEVVLKSSSGYVILDESAIKLIKAACPFHHRHNADLRIEIPITYKLMR